MSRARLILSCIFLWVCGIFFASHVDAGFSVGNGPATGDPLYQLIGNAKELIGDSMMLKADSYFHGGVQEDFSWEHHEEREQEGHIEDTDEHAYQTASDWPAQVNARVKSHEHYHLKQAEQQEILPFLFLTTHLDPYYIEGQLTTAYWLERRLGKSEEAIRVLLAARKANPSSWEIRNELGNIYFRRQEYSKAVYFFEEAVTKLTPANSQDSGVAHLHYFLAESYYALGEKVKARESYQAFLRLLKPGEALPLRSQVTQRLESLV